MPLNRDLQLYFEEKKKRIDDHLADLLPESNSLYGTLSEAASYSLLSPGKRLRPILTIAAAEMLGGSEDAAITPACAIEMVHTYSLIHDDLPCMDDDDFRRGLPSLHKAYTEAAAVLTGDFLLTHAFQTIAESPGLSDFQKVALVSTLASNSGGEGMIAGQIMDIEAENRTITPEHLQLIHIKKTALLISASLEFGAIVAGASEQSRQHLKSFGLNVGLAFQIMDDILDVTQSLAKHGRNESSDEEKNKSTYVSFHGLDSARALAEKYVVDGRHILRELPGNTAILDSFATYILETGY